MSRSVRELEHNSGYAGFDLVVQAIFRTTKLYAGTQTSLGHEGFRELQSGSLDRTNLEGGSQLDSGSGR